MFSRWQAKTADRGAGGSEKLSRPYADVARVRPQISKGITDLLLLNLVWLKATCPSKKLIGELFSRLESRSLSELTRQIAPPTKNGHTLVTMKMPATAQRIMN